ncbi:MAG: indole-3-glycerol phosphate synthase TrpC [Candidatus Latescibacterota bacterium]
MSDLLEQIVQYKREFVAARRGQRSLADVRSAARDTPDPADFAAALAGQGVSLIAEVKKASPSRGVIRPDFDPERIADAYAASGASALSVLTDEAFFQGADAHLQVARRVSGLPTLRKDFVVDEYQIHESRLIGADAVLLIVALMDGSQFADYLGLATELGLAALVEVHTEAEVQRALAAEPRVMGINNRDLKTFETTLETTLRLVEHLPAGILSVSESGIHSRGDVEALQACGVDAVLVGEALMRAPDIGAKVRELLGRE